MKKKILTVLALMALGLVIVSIGISGDDPLDPSVEKTLAYQLPKVPPEENAYIGVSGLSQVEDGDVVAAGLKRLRSGVQYQKKQPQEPLFEFSYRNPCIGLDEHENCLDQIVADAQIVNEEIQKNNEIIKRYHIVQAMPLYVNDTADIFDVVPQYHYLVDTSRLLNAKALLDIKRGDIDGGLASIEREMDFYKKIYQSEHINLIDLMIAAAGTQLNLIALSKVIEDGQIDINGYEERLRKMLDLQLTPSLMMTRALETEKRVNLQTFGNILLTKTVGWEAVGRFFKELPDKGLNQENELTEGVFSFFLKKNMTSNLLASRMDEDIRRIESAPLLNFPDFYITFTQTEKQELKSRSNPGIKDLYKRYGLFFFKNYTGEIMAAIAHPDYMRYLARLNDTLVFSRMTRAQLELRMLAERPGDVSEALAKLGPETWNSYTGKPFEWNQEKNTLWAVKAAMLGSSFEHDQSGMIIEAAVPLPRP